MALIRYPGSKEKLKKSIWSCFPDKAKGVLWSHQGDWEYREPFFGAGAIGLAVLGRLSDECSVWLNDIDPGMSALWVSVRDHHKELIALVDEFEPSAEAFALFKAEDGRRDLPLWVIAIRKLALHRMSFSGLGFMAGGPIGGKDQSNQLYDVACRWTGETIKKEIQKLHLVLSAFDDFKFTNLDFVDLIEDAPAECFIYADPPYYEKGPGLYKHSMTHADHVRLAGLLRATEATWVLSYDDHKDVRALYQDWARIEPLKFTDSKRELTYTMAITDGKRPKNREILIMPR